MRTLLIDGDILVVSIGAVVELEVNWGDDEWTLHCDVGEVKETLLKRVESLKRELKADDAVITLSKGQTFRHEIYDGYKAGRSRKPVGTGEVKRWLIEEHGAKYIPGIEADDIMGILATNPRIIKGEKIIVSLDKDMFTIPGTIYVGGELHEVSEGEADYNWLTQTLTGDTTDGYPGCPGIGPAKAKDILDNNKGWEAYISTKATGECTTKWRSGTMGSQWEAIVSHFAKVGLTEADAILQARLARILRSEDFNFKKKEPILWRPKS